MKLDFATHDILVTVAADSRKGVWGAQVFHKLQKTNIRTAGQLPTEASAHTLQLVSLATSLRSITKAQVRRLGQNLPRAITKPRVMIVTSDASFADALRAVTLNQLNSNKPLRAGKNFFPFLLAQMGRFNVDVQLPEPGDTTVLVIRDWAESHIIAPKHLAGLPASLTPSAISQVV